MRTRVVATFVPVTAFVFALIVVVSAGGPTTVESSSSTTPRAVDLKSPEPDNYYSQDIAHHLMEGDRVDEFGVVDCSQDPACADWVQIGSPIRGWTIFPLDRGALEDPDRIPVYETRSIEHLIGYDVVNLGFVDLQTLGDPAFDEHELRVERFGPDLASEMEAQDAPVG